VKRVVFGQTRDCDGSRGSLSSTSPVHRSMRHPHAILRLDVHKILFPKVLSGSDEVHFIFCVDLLKETAK
jgi:hypothetical protein